MLHNPSCSFTIPYGRSVLRIVAPNLSPRCCFQLPCVQWSMSANHCGTWSKVMNLKGKIICKNNFNLILRVLFTVYVWKRIWLTCHVTSQGPGELHPTDVWHHAGCVISGLLHFLLILALLFTVSCTCKATKTVTDHILDVTVVSVDKCPHRGLVKLARTIMITIFSKYRSAFCFCYSASITVQERFLNTEYGNFFCHCCPKTLGRKRDSGLQTPCVDFFQSHEGQ